MLGRAGEAMPVLAQHITPCLLGMLGLHGGRGHGVKKFTAVLQTLMGEIHDSESTSA